MRIMAIRGKNLASLAEPFEILLTQGTLANVGLFAITGQTGAGKSTILDALCLALYDEIPRLPDGQGVAIGAAHEEDNQRLKNNDVRSILRRGSQHAYAEVDFVGRDKQHYRARWEVRKTRTSSLQKQEMSLQNLSTGQLVGQNKKDTLAAISERVGLSFEQFRRSVLLAQGDFAAFLKAKKDERSSLLERITGTELYSSLSKEAFKRAKLEKEHWQRLQDRCNHSQPLSEAARVELSERLNQLNAQLDALNKQLSANQSMIDWYDAQELLYQSKQQASAALMTCQQQHTDAKDRREFVMHVLAAQPVQLLLFNYQQADSDYTHASAALETSTAQAVASELSLQEASALLSLRGEQVFAAETALCDAAPLIKQARALDTQLEGISQRLTETLSVQRSAEQTRSAAKQQADTLVASLQHWQQELQTLKSQLAAYQPYSAVIADWTHWSGQLQRYQSLSSAQQTSQQQLHRSETLAAQTLLQRTALCEQLAQSEATEQHLQHTLQHLQTPLAGAALTELHHQKDQLEQQRQKLAAQRSLAEQYLACLSQNQQTQDNFSGASHDLNAANAKLTELYAEQRLQQAVYTEAKQTLDLFHASSHKNAQAFRQLLSADKPCPVCGSLTHPWANQDNALMPLSATQQQRVLALENQQTLLATQIDQAEKNQRHALLQTELCQAQLATLTAQLETLQASWQTFTAANALIDAPLLEQLTTEQTVLENNYTQLKAQEKTLLAQHEALTDCQQRLSASQRHRAALQNDYGRVDGQYRELTGQVRQHQESLTQTQQDLTAIETGLENALSTVSHWRDYLQNSHALQTIVNHNAQLTEQVSQAQQQLTHTTQQQQLNAQHCQASEQQYAQLCGQFAQLNTEQCRLSEQRAACLPENVSADAYENRLQQQLLLARTALHEAQTAVNQLNAQLASHKSDQQHWQQESLRRYQLLQKAHTDLQQALTEKNLSLNALTALLSCDSQWLSAEQAALAHLEQALHEAVAIVKLKTAQLDQHQQHIPALNPSQVLVQREALSLQHSECSAALQECHIQWREDANKRNAYASLNIELSKQAHTWQQWQALSDLIGSSSGAKFRVFAQSLTLEALLGHSNQHLKEFAPRYLLQRVPRSDLELQIIDQDMANEVRSVHSLSGGESFLVSLALALGLASLAASQTRVESLFIDEGFGSLDPETLDIALASLDTLQSLGRKIGIISHVPVLVERIGARVMVEKQGGGKSKVIISEGF